MDFGFIILTIFGLSLFEVITSVDNAIINAEVLRGMSQKARRWFLLWGFIFAVFVVRGLLPLLIVWIANPQLGIISVFFAAFSQDPKIEQAIEATSPLLLLAGGVFLVFLFFNWLFLEPKNYGLRGERFFHAQGAWFFAVVSVLLTVIVWLALQSDPMLAFAAVVGSTAFFIIHGFRQFAEEQERRLISGNMSDISKIAYLEVLDSTFSIDGVIGAFAFTFSIPLILLGNGLGALVLRKLTVSNIERIKKYKYLKNGAMYSILFLGAIMVLDSFGYHIPAWLSPVITFGTVGYFFLKSKKELL
ncbi:MAG: hypothetical protein A3H17_01655 [Candidatus Levybacteria bacterium RIFCSPLOWO2_12_FULL_37_14]|nr:MAG: hypothetical protein US43_C0001G0009 [Candidatus Levybacteria bacterium GW2011_GWA1_37_16]KKQ38373.1 MAG: hypothetical protein US55_C0008G0018 [Candidatus Levybacteria bacterium GW2011_GWC2_37_7]KKQ42768.1 MAG: hypothetical protein US59_C0004G0008 [Candidatus Levybacteria bacterium GW2011_GWB1_37_8]OGH51102.1 MAG: hypothetical protein A3H17_01655 [Candidatus Levybacteria bacterium RIFCSPLOWO2_12_FULL_37_14]